jgi:signal transduction histidine kinase
MPTTTKRPPGLGRPRALSRADLLPSAEAVSGEPAEAETPSERQLRDLCHDLTVQAATVRMLAESLRAEPGLAGASDRIAQIVRESEQMARVCTDALTTPAVEQVWLDGAVQEVALGARLVHATAIEIEACPVSVPGHRTAISRLLMNLVDNACRAAGPTGRVRISVRELAFDAEIEVADSGLGFPVGREGRKLSSSCRAGRGLRIVNQVVLQHGGGAVVGRSCLGGASVRIALPRQLDGRNTPMTTSTDVESSYR